MYRMYRRRFTARRKRALAACGSALALLAAIAAGCADDPIPTPAVMDSGPPPAVLGASVCPEAAPLDGGESCVLPEGTTCSFGACGSAIATCTRGVWRYSGNPPPRPACPKDFPASLSACPPCWPTGVECTYGSTDCAAPDASPNTTVAACVSGGPGQPERWALRTFVCGASDAGADVQGDAEPEAD